MNLVLDIIPMNFRVKTIHLFSLNNTKVIANPKGPKIITFINNSSITPFCLKITNKSNNFSMLV